MAGNFRTFAVSPLALCVLYRLIIIGAFVRAGNGRGVLHLNGCPLLASPVAKDNALATTTSAQDIPVWYDASRRKCALRDGCATKPHVYELSEVSTVLKVAAMMRVALVAKPIPIQTSFIAHLSTTRCIKGCAKAYRNYPLM